MSRASIRVQALRDTLLAVLRDTDERLTAHEIIARAFEDGRAHPYRHYSIVYNNLRVMDRAGLIKWHGWDSANSCTWWSAVARPDDVETSAIAALEALWREPSL